MKMWILAGLAVLVLVGGWLATRSEPDAGDPGATVHRAATAPTEHTMLRGTGSRTIPAEAPTPAPAAEVPADA